MKHTIAWHQEGLENSTEYHGREKVRLEAEARRLMRGIADDCFRQRQIDTTVAKGKPDFDAEMFMKKERLEAEEKAGKLAKSLNLIFLDGA
jgi:hypothetical protein